MFQSFQPVTNDISLRQKPPPIHGGYRAYIDVLSARSNIRLLYLSLKFAFYIALQHPPFTLLFNIHLHSLQDRPVYLLWRGFLFSRFQLPLGLDCRIAGTPISYPQN